MIGQHYVVTGGTSGLGLTVVKQLLYKGVQVTLLVRDLEKPQRLFDEQEMQRINLIQCDLLKREDIMNLQHHFNHKINGLIYSAGMGRFRSIENHTYDEMNDTYQLNVISFNLLFKVLQPYLEQHAHIVGVTSQSAFVTQMHVGHYGASKAAFYHLLNTLRLEYPNYHVMTVNPGPIDTPFHGKADPSLAYAEQMKPIMLDPEKVAHQIVDGIITHKEEINVPQWMHQMLKFYRLAPRFLEKHFTSLFSNKVEGN